MAGQEHYYHRSFRGLGYAIAEIFAENGNDLFLTSVNESRCRKRLKIAQQISGHYYLRQSHRSEKKKQALAFGEWRLKNGSPDVLVTTPGVCGSNVHNEEDGALEEMIETNVYSAYHVTRAIVPAMIEKKSGHIFHCRR